MPVVLMQFCCFTVLNNGRAPAHVPAAHMSTGPAGGGRENQLYIFLVGTACIGGGVYVCTYTHLLPKDDSDQKL